PIVKPSSLTNFSPINKNRKIPINFKQHHQLIPLPLTTPNQDILIPTPHPSLIRFSQSTLRPLRPTPPPLKRISL
ncbi:hypothetical protein, partial [Staphylococcus epidermidis]|uniref:hypothetical protein n=1 Tax=Staphylococcus epidermidis TaxID=1282 RepID=UPI001C92BF61